MPQILLWLYFLKREKYFAEILVRYNRLTPIVLSTLRDRLFADDRRSFFIEAHTKNLYQLGKDF